MEQQKELSIQDSLNSLSPKQFLKFLSGLEEIVSDLPDTLKKVRRLRKRMETSINKGDLS